MALDVHNQLTKETPTSGLPTIREAPESAKHPLILADLELVSFHGTGYIFCVTQVRAKPASVAVHTELMGSIPFGSAARLFSVATGWSQMAAVNLIGSYNYALVALSVLIAIVASYAALDLAGRVTAAGGWTRAVWLLGGAGAMGTGIWSMHYIGMLAFILPIPVAYHWPTVLLSLLAAILASVVALYVVSREKMGCTPSARRKRPDGCGYFEHALHRHGRHALPAMCQYNSFLIVLSVVFAVLISLAALWITFHFRDEKTRIGREKLAGAVVMGAAIPVMHYTGMAAASFTPSGMPADLTDAVSISTLGTAGIAAVTFVVLGLALLTSWVDRQFAAQTLELQERKLQRAEAYLAEAETLSHTGSFGWRVSAGEIIWSEESSESSNTTEQRYPPWELFSNGFTRKMWHSSNRRSSAPHRMGGILNMNIAW